MQHKVYRVSNSSSCFGDIERTDFTRHPQCIKSTTRQVQTKRIQILAALFLYWITVEPATFVWTVESALIGKHSGLTVVILRAEAEIELIRHRAMQFEDVAVGVVDVLSGDHASFGDIADDVSVVVVARG